jgi:hypothetical protein
MNNTTITRYLNCDLLIHKNDVERLGFDKNYTEAEMIDLAVKNSSPIIIKNGKGKWYLKGKNESIVSLKSLISINTGKYARRVCLLLE